MYVLRFAFPFAWSPAARLPAFYVAHAMTAYAGIVVAAVLFVARPTAPAAVSVAPPSSVPAGSEAISRKPERVTLGRPVLLATATLLFPLVDVLVISTTHDAATTGAFSRVALASRIVFFGGAALLPVLLPHQLHAAKTGAPLPAFVVSLERWLTPSLVAAALALAVVSDRVVLRPSGDERAWLFATCLSAALLIALLVHVQRLAARGELRAATACVGGVVVTRALAAGFAALVGAVGYAGVTRYALVVVAGDALVLLLARTGSRFRFAKSGS
jgi:hypothetical protein